MQKIKSTVTGTVWEVNVEEGNYVEEGQELLILESMKMEIPVNAIFSQVVKAIHVREGDFVNIDDLLIEIE